MQNNSSTMYHALFMPHALAGRSSRCTWRSASVFSALGGGNKSIITNSNSTICIRSHGVDAWDVPDMLANVDTRSALQSRRQCGVIDRMIECTYKKR